MTRLRKIRITKTTIRPVAVLMPAVFIFDPTVSLESSEYSPIVVETAVSWSLYVMVRIIWLPSSTFLLLERMI